MIAEEALEEVFGRPAPGPPVVLGCLGVRSFLGFTKEVSLDRPGSWTRTLAVVGLLESNFAFLLHCDECLFWLRTGLAEGSPSAQVKSTYMTMAPQVRPEVQGDAGSGPLISEAR